MEIKRQCSINGVKSDWGTFFICLVCFVAMWEGWICFKILKNTKVTIQNCLCEVTYMVHENELARAFYPSCYIYSIMFLKSMLNILHIVYILCSKASFSVLDKNILYVPLKSFFYQGFYSSSRFFLWLSNSP
jgi:hypothetical protein